MLRQKIILPQFHSHSLYPCFFCRENPNIFSACPFQHYQPFAEGRYLPSNVEQERNPYSRRNTKFYVLKDLDKIQRAFQYFKEFSPESEIEELSESHDSNYKHERESKISENLLTTIPSIFLQSSVVTSPKRRISSSSIFENEIEDENDSTANDNLGSKRFFSNTDQLSSSIDVLETSGLMHPKEMKNGTTSVFTERLHGSEKECSNHSNAVPHVSQSSYHNENQRMFSIDYSRFIEKEYTTSNFNGESNPETSHLLKPYPKKMNSKRGSYKSSSLGKKNKKNDSYYSNHNRKPTYEEYIKYPLFWFEFEKMKDFKRFYFENNADTVINDYNIIFRV